MSIPEFKIGSQKFLGMSPQPKPAHNQVTYLTRTNTDYASIFQDGIRGTLHEIITEVEANGPGDVEALISAYQQLVGGVPQLIKWQGRNFGTYLIHDVNCTATSVLYISFRRRSSASSAEKDFIVMARWTLYPVTDVH